MKITNSGANSYGFEIDIINNLIKGLYYGRRIRFLYITSPHYNSNSNYGALSKLTISNNKIHNPKADESEGTIHIFCELTYFILQIMKLLVELMELL